MKVWRRLSSLSRRFPKRKLAGSPLDGTKKLMSRVKTCKWVGDCFIYTNGTNRLSYLIGDQAHVLNHFDQSVKDCSEEASADE